MGEVRAVSAPSAPSALEEAMIMVLRATDGRGLHINLCPGMYDPGRVRARIWDLAQCFAPDAVTLDSDEAAARNLGLLCKLLQEHRKKWRTSSIEEQTGEI